MPILNEYPQLQMIQTLARQKKMSVFLVGGYIRDALMGSLKRDFDFAVSKDAILLARHFARKVRGSFVLLDDEHGCARVIKKIKGRVLTFDFAEYRAETIKQDLAHRDFTINTLCVDLLGLDDQMDLEDVVLDYKNGLKDLNARTVKMTSVKVFKDDPLRMLRAFSLQATLNFKIEDKTLLQIQKDADLIRTVSYERIRDEFFKILSSPQTYENIQQMEAVGLLDRVIPQIHVMYNCKQGRYHHLDVWAHSMETLRQMELMWSDLGSISDGEDVRINFSEFLGGERTRWALIKLACLLHDIGKPEAKKKVDDRFLFHAHEHIGQSIVRTVAQLLKLSNRERYALEDMVRWHLRPGYLSNFQRPSEKAIYRYFRDTKDEAVSIAVLSLADQQSTRGPLTTAQKQAHHKEICMDLIARYFVIKRKKPFERLINGHDLVRALQIRPSPFFSKILSEVEEQQNLDKIKTKEDALILARQIFERIKK
ncbi:MAG: HD domain-containing protein [Candidatus Omnitrophica bacterium]|nr:HD domain-containing protein [Candidatus Omnitrophota bacterium]